MKFLRFLGWVLIPYLMILFRWKKSRWPFRIFAIVWSLILVSSVAGAASGGQTTSISATQNTRISSPVSSADSKVATKKEPIQQQPIWVQVGKPGDVDNLQITVNDLQETQTIGSNGIYSTANGIYWVLNVTVKNNDSSPRTIDSSMFQINGDNNSTYAPDTGVDAFANGNNDFFLQQLNPGVSATGSIVFEMPEYMTSGHIGEHYSLVVSDGPFGSSQTFALP